MWFVMSGKLNLTKKYKKKNIFGRSIINHETVMEIGTGEMICEQPLFNMFPQYTATVITDECRLIKVRYNDLKTRFSHLLPEIEVIS